MTDQQILDRFREIAGDESGDVLVEWREGGAGFRIRPSGCGVFWAVQFSGAYSADGWGEPEDARGDRTSYEAASVVMRQLGDWQDGRGTNIHRLDGGKYVVVKDGVHLNVEEGWGEFPDATVFPDRPSAMLAAYAAEIGDVP